MGLHSVMGRSAASGRVLVRVLVLAVAFAAAACAVDDGGNPPAPPGVSGGLPNQGGGAGQPPPGGSGAGGEALPSGGMSAGGGILPSGGQSPGGTMTSGGAGMGGESDAGMTGGAGANGSGGEPSPPTGPTDPECDMNGRWIAAQSTYSEALGATQVATNWFYFDIRHEGDAFIVEDSLNCGLVVRGTTEVTLSDATLEALAQRNKSSVGRGGTFHLNADRTACVFTLDRTYNIRGANREMFLDSKWRIGDPPIALTELSLPANAAQGMEDWDNDGYEAITFETGFGFPRYAAQLDWNEYTGTVPPSTDQFGGEGVVDVAFDGIEAISTETSLVTALGSTPLGYGYAYLARVGDALQLGSGERPELETCRNVQALAIERFGDPPSS